MCSPIHFTCIPLIIYTSINPMHIILYTFPLFGISKKKINARSRGRKSTIAQDIERNFIIVETWHENNVIKILDEKHRNMKKERLRRLRQRRKVSMKAFCSFCIIACCARIASCFAWIAVYCAWIW